MKTLPERETARESLLRELARMSVGVPPVRRISAPEGRWHEVLAEVDVEGATYRLSRLRPRSGTVTLTPRELQVARLVARGLGTKAIGQVLGISPWTVLTHLRRIYSRLHVSSRAAMVARLSDEGLL